MAFEVGTVVDGTVVNITNYGAFVELSDGKVGLVHISEISDKYVTNIADILKLRQPVKVKVLGLNEKGYDLSIKQAERKSPPVERKPFDKGPGGGKRPKIKLKSRTLGDVENEGQGRDHLSFEDKLARYMKESEERLLDLKRNVEAKRGKGRIR